MGPEEKEDNLGLQDAVEALFEAAGKKDWAGAAVAFSDARRLSCEESETEDAGEGDGKKPSIAFIFGEKKK